jgi:eight-cysteine-cluster-containing protein
MRIILGIVAMSVALLSCLAGDPPRARTDGSCFIGGCSAEVCSDRTGYVTPCIWRDGYACLRTAMCERQPGDVCGWTPTPELEACLASHDPLPGGPGR